jgi:hypothetical protein
MAQVDALLKQINQARALNTSNSRSRPSTAQTPQGSANRSAPQPSQMTPLGSSRPSTAQTPMGSISRSTPRPSQTPLGSASKKSSRSSTAQTPVGSANRSAPQPSQMTPLGSSRPSTAQTPMGSISRSTPRPSQTPLGSASKKSSRSSTAQTPRGSANRSQISASRNNGSVNPVSIFGQNKNVPPFGR